MQLHRYSTNAKRYPPKKFLETLSWFYLPEFQEKGKGLPKSDTLRYVTGRVIIIQFLFLPGS